MNKETCKEEIMLTLVIAAIISAIIMGLINIAGDRDENLLEWGSKKYKLSHDN